MKTTIVQTGTANTASVQAALERVGSEVLLSKDPSEIAASDSVVLPGVGSFAAGVERLRELELIPVLRAIVQQQRPLLCICLGLQLLCKESEESPGFAGLAVLNTTVRRLNPTNTADVCVPQLGWNQIEPMSQCQLLQGGYGYYANSFAITEPPPGFGYATTTHGNAFVAAIEKGPLLACQFHPELSGGYGQALLERWLRRASAC